MDIALIFEQYSFTIAAQYGPVVVHNREVPFNANKQNIVVPLYSSGDWLLEQKLGKQQTQEYINEAFFSTGFPSHDCSFHSQS